MQIVTPPACHKTARQRGRQTEPRAIDRQTDLLPNTNELNTPSNEGKITLIISSFFLGGGILGMEGSKCNLP